MTDTPNHGDGWQALTFDELDGGETGYMRKVRAAAGITAFGMNVLTLAPHTVNRFHRHATQQEVFFVHAGELTVEFEDGEATVGAGGVVRVDPQAWRRLGNLTDEPVVIVALGGADGYVERDGELRPDELEQVAAGGPMIGVTAD